MYGWIFSLPGHYDLAFTAYGWHPLERGQD